MLLSLEDQGMITGYIISLSKGNGAGADNYDVQKYILPCHLYSI